jgi:hypothetical protein
MKIDLGGALEIAGTNRAFNIHRGDVVLMDSDQLWHGSWGYQGHKNPCQPGLADCVVGIFILWKSYCCWKGIPKQLLERELFEEQTMVDHQ